MICIENHNIHFDSNVTDDTVNQLCDILDNLDGKYDIYNLHIKSNGGNVMAGLKAYDKIKSSKYIINTYANDVIGGIASIMFIVGKERFFTPDCIMYIGKSVCLDKLKSNKELLKSFKFMDGLNKQINELYLLHSNKRFTLSKLQKMQENDGTYLKCYECQKYGLVDTIIPNEKLGINF